MELSREDARQVIWDEHPDWSMAPDTKRLVDHRRWYVIYEAVFCHKPTNLHYRLQWPIPATESQEMDAFEYSDPEPVLVEQKEVIALAWVPVA
jgi:hypothetical protein